ncbi:MAG: hypothetical protein HY673_26840 [Chloroflexi bacterium]|nr:hypothetical protein [Chloroflexota bacterium]
MGIVKAGVAAALVAGIGLGLALGWGLNELTRGPLRGGPGPRSREEEEPRTRSGAGPCQTAPAVPPAPPAAPTQSPGGAFDLCGPSNQACAHSEGWARRRQEQVLARLSHLLEDGRCHNGRHHPAAEVPTQTEAEREEEEIAGRIVEIVVGQPGLSPAQSLPRTRSGVSQRLQQQDGTAVEA